MSVRHSSMNWQAITADTSTSSVLPEVAADVAEKIAAIVPWQAAPGGAPGAVGLPWAHRAFRIYVESRCECLDQMLITGERHRGLVLGEYADHYNLHRTYRVLHPRVSGRPGGQPLGDFAGRAIEQGSQQAACQVPGSAQ
jgi:hypothetical protein